MTDMVGDEQHTEDSSCWEFNSVKVEVQAVTSAERSPHFTNAAIITTVALEGKMLQDFECDTAASHSVLSLQAFKKLASAIGRLQGKKEQVAIRLADGSQSDKCNGSIELCVQGFETAKVPITFFVIDGPNNLLGRHAIEQLWPYQYKALRDVATYGKGKVSVKGMYGLENTTPHKQQVFAPVQSRKQRRQAAGTIA